MPFCECIPSVQVLLTMLISNLALPTSCHEEHVANDVVCRKLSTSIDPHPHLNKNRGRHTFAFNPRFVAPVNPYRTSSPLIQAASEDVSLQKLASDQECAVPTIRCEFRY